MTTRPSSDAGYIDLQVNGYAGVDFNRDGLTGQQLHHACKAMAADGVAGFLPTIITAEVDAMCRRLRRIVELRAADALAKAMILGIHIEGPFLSDQPGFIGAHPPAAARPAEVQIIQRLLESAGGLTRIVTLAPERDGGCRVTRMLADSGIIVAAGHTDATLDQLRSALDAGLAMFTHLGNGCPMMLHRHDNIIQRALSLAERLSISFVADGAHVPFTALTNYLKIIPDEHIIIVSDAIAAAGLGPGRYTLAERDVVVGSDLVPRAPDGSHFIGSGWPVKNMAQSLRTKLNVSVQQVNQWTISNPQRLLRIPHPAAA